MMEHTRSTQFFARANKIKHVGMTMKDDDMIFASMNSAVSEERPGLFSMLFATSHKDIPKGGEDYLSSSSGSSTCSQTKKKRNTKSTTKRERASSPEQVGKGLMDRAEGQASLGQWEKAFALWDEALELQRDKLGSRNLSVALTLARRGRAHAQMGKWYPAVLDLEKAAHIFQALNDHYALASDTLIQLASAQERMGHLDEAVANMEKALVLKEKLKDEVGVARLNCLIGDCRRQQRDYEQALQSYRVGLECYEQAGVDKNHPDVVWATRRASDRSMQGHLFWRQSEQKHTSG